MRSVLHPPASAQTQRRLGGQAQGWKMLPAFLDIFRQGETHPHQLPRHLCNLEGTMRPRPVPSACQSSSTGVHPTWECLVPAGLLFYSTPSQGLGRGRSRQRGSPCTQGLCCGLAQHGFRQRPWKPGQVIFTTEWEGLLRGPGWQVHVDMV